jgi:tripartite-type tricarboxylate transporter receptor subunit TctC
MAQVNAGKLRAVGVTSAGRSSVVPVVPSLSEAGIKGLELEIWNAVAAPNSLPKAHVGKLSALLTEIVRRPAVRERIVAQGWQVAGTSPEGLANRIQKDTATMSQVIERTGAAKK